MAKRKLTPEERKIRKRKLMIRRIVFFSVCALILVLIIALLVILARAVFIKKNTPKPEGFSQIGPAAIVENAELSHFERLYDYASPVPESEAVPDTYFTDALFLGDSRTLGLSMYDAIAGSRTLASGNVSVDTAMSFKFGDKKVTLPDVLAEKPFSSVYMAYGLNELGWPYMDAFISAYSGLIDQIKAVQPLTTIYVEAILPVSANKNAASEYFNNKNIDAHNEALLKMCAKKKVYFVDLNAAYKDESGVLPAGSTSDGINLNTDCFDIWCSYLKTHTVKKEFYTN
ncbi:MAG: GDSL-type esterase/lipase family protein [Oscillospiraceae bacterium]